jgi:hypothetical protein
MRKLWFLFLALATISISAQAQQIYGDYVETRSADVYTGPCFANSEVGLTGDQAIMAWRIRAGQWDGIKLDGLSVVGVVKARATLGDPFNNPLPAKAVIIVDSRATDIQKAALVSFAQKMAAGLLDNVVGIQVAPIQFDVSHSDGHYGRVALHAGNIAIIETRSLSDKDHICGNEEVYYPPLVQMAHAMPAVAAIDSYGGPELGVSWTLVGKRSAFVGSFSR